MGIKRAMEALTDPHPNARQELIRFIADRAMLKKQRQNTIYKDDIWYIVLILLRWGAITKTDIPNLSRLAVGGVVEDAYDAVKILMVERA